MPGIIYKYQPNMKKTLLTFLLLSALNGYSQDYIPFLDDTSWTLAIGGFFGTQYIAVEPAENVTVGANTYVKYTNAPQSENGEVLVREDVAARKVYRYAGGQDVLLYDFTLLEGETTTLNDGKLYTVTTRDSVAVISGRKRVRINLVHFVGTTAMNSETWVESVGNTNHPLKPNYELLSDPSIDVACSFSGNDNIYNKGLANTGTATNCPEVTAAVKQLTALNTSFAPNPFTIQTTIKTEGMFTNASLSVINALGQQVKQLDNLNGNEIILNRDNLTAGLYFIRLQQSGKIVYSNKVVVTD